PCLVTGASAPPAIANSAAPDRIIVLANATASSPDGQAEETVAARARAPIRSAITFAAAWGLDAPSAVGEIASIPRLSDTRKTFSITSKALVLTPTTIGVGLGKSASLISRPASASAIIVAE